MSDALKGIASILGVGLPNIDLGDDLTAKSVASMVGIPGIINSVSSVDIATVLDSIAKNPRDRVYKDQTIYLDGYTFTNCCFSNCTLYTDSGVFALKSCLVMPDSRFAFGRSALRIIKVLNMALGSQGSQWAPNYRPATEPNGSITVE